MARGGRRGLAVAAGVSLALHGALLFGLWLDRPPPPPPDPPVFELSLVRPSETETLEPRPDQLPAVVSSVVERSAPAAGSDRPPQHRRPTAAPFEGYAVPAGPDPPRAAPEPSTGMPAPAPPPPVSSRLGAVLRAEPCSDLDRLSARDRDACQERLGRARADGPVPPTTRLRRALAAADDARAKAARRLGETFDDPHVAQCAGSGLCRRELTGIPFGEPPPALPVIPPSTLRGDDDALRTKPRP